MVQLRDGVRVLLDDLSDQPVDASNDTSNGKATSDTASEPHKLILPALPVVQESDLAPEWSGETPPVLCLGVRTPLDMAAAEILGQLVQRHGVPAAVATRDRKSVV